MSIQVKDRRTAILDAVIQLLATKGLSGVTHRAADMQAGLPQGSTTYYFPKKTALLREAAAHLAQELEKDCDDLQIAFADVAAKQGMAAAIDLAAQGLLASADKGKELLLARIELTLAAARDEDLSDVGERLSVAARRPIEFFVNLVTGGQNTVPMETCVGLIDGVALMYVTGQGPKPTVAQVSTVLRSLTIV